LISSKKKNTDQLIPFWSLSQRFYRRRVRDHLLDIWV